jgi:hypothetical protein
MSPSRRQLLAAVAAVGVGTASFHRAVAARAAEPKVEAVTEEMVKNAEWVAGITLTDAERKSVAGELTRTLRSAAALNRLDIGNAVPPAVHFNPTPGDAPSGGRGKVAPTPIKDVKKPEQDDDLAFAPLATLTELLRTKQISSTELTKLYLARLKTYDPALLCVVALTEELALKQTAAADADIRSAASAGTGAWRCAGRSTRSARCAGASRTARWCSAPSTARTGRTRPFRTGRSTGRRT